MKRSSTWFVFTLLALVLLLVACQGKEAASATPAPTPTPDPASILEQAGEAMQGLDSVHFTITRSGGLAYFNEEQSLSINSAEGDYVAPDAVRALLKVSGTNVTLEIQTVAIGEEQWITNPLTQRWEKLPPGWGFNPAIIFDPELGWRPLLSENIAEAQLVDTTPVEGEPRYHLRANVAGERVAIVTAGVASSEAPVTVDVWVEPTTFHVTRLSFATPSSGEEPSQWELTFSNFNADITIEPPE